MHLHKFDLYIGTVELSIGNKSAILIGLDGPVGKFCLEYLLASNSYSKVRCFVEKNLNLKHQKLHEHIIEFRNMKNYAKLFSGNDVFLCMDMSSEKDYVRDAYYKVVFGYNYQVAAFAKKNGANQVMVLSTIGADKTSRLFNLRIKGELEEVVSDLDFWATHIFRPSIVLPDRNDNRFGEKVASKIGGLFNKISSGFLDKIKPVDAQVIAKAMVESAQLFKEGKFVYSSDWIQKLSKKEDELRSKY